MCQPLLWLALIWPSDGAEHHNAIWPYHVVGHLPDVNQHYLVYACQVNHSCPPMRYCVIDEVFDFSFTSKSNCSCSTDQVQWDRTSHLPGVIRQKRGCEICLHKSLWPAIYHDYVGAAMLLLGSVLSGAVGVGGGGLGVPILVIAMGFHVKEAVPLSHVLVFGSVFAQNLVNVPRRHPLTDARPLVDAEAALLLMPCMLLGHSLGVLVGPSLPEEWIEVVAVIVLVFAALKTTRTAFKAFLKEVETGKRLPSCFERSLETCGHDRVRVDLAANVPSSGSPLAAPSPSAAYTPSADTLTDAKGGATNGAADAAGARRQSMTWYDGMWELPRPHILESLLPREHARSDAPTNANANSLSPAATYSALTPAPARSAAVSETEADEATAGELTFLAHAPRQYARQQLATSKLRTVPVVGTPSPSRAIAVEVGAPSPSHAIAVEMDSRENGGEELVLRLREYPQPIDGGRVLLLLLTWILFAAQYRLDSSPWSLAYTSDHPSCEGSKFFSTHCLDRYLPYFGFRALLYALVVTVSMVAITMTLESQRQREAYRVPVLPGDMVWTLQKALGTQLMAVIVGTIAGLLGLGGGELMAPLLVHLGMLPEVVSAVNAFIIFFTAAADLEHYSDLGVLQLYADTVTRPGYVVLALTVGFIGSFIGRVAATRIVARFAHPSILIMLLGVTLLLSAVLLVGRLIVRAEQQVSLRSHDLYCAY